MIHEQLRTSLKKISKRYFSFIGIKHIFFINFNPGKILPLAGNFVTMAAQNHPEGPHDHDAAESPESLLIGGPVQTLPTEAAAASPVTYVSGDTPPILLMHGADDRVVSAAQSEELHDRLVALGAPATLRVVPGADHCFTGVDLAPLVDGSLEHFAKTLS